jgi:type IV pilus assembly protein PilC
MMDMSVDELNSFYEKALHTIKRWQFNTKKQLAFLEDLYLLINDGIPANRAVDMMGLVTTGLTREVALSMSQKIAEGQPLAEGMREWFSMNVVEIIRVGEAGGALAQTMKSAINMLSQQGLAIGAFIAAVSYPLLVIIIACAVILYLNHSVFEQFKMIKSVDKWPDAGRRLIYIGQFVQYWWWIVIVGIIATMVLIKQVFTKYTGSLRPTLDAFPPFSFYRKLVAARLLETMGLLVANGVVFKSAIKVMQYHANPYLLSHLINMEHLLSTGKTNIADVLATGLVEENDLMRLRVMAEVKGFEHGLIRMGVRGTEQATLTLKFISKIIGGLLLVAGGLLVIAIVQGIYMTGMVLGT